MRGEGSICVRSYSWRCARKRQPVRIPSDNKWSCVLQLAALNKFRYLKFIYVLILPPPSFTNKRHLIMKRLSAPLHFFLICSSVHRVFVYILGAAKCWNPTLMLVAYFFNNLHFNYSCEGRLAEGGSIQFKLGLNCITFFGWQWKFLVLPLLLLQPWLLITPNNPPSILFVPCFHI